MPTNIYVIEKWMWMRNKVNYFHQNIKQEKKLPGQNDKGSNQHHSIIEETGSSRSKDANCDSFDN
jgi:hypothetical protein